jgi:hypothetical protein
MEQELFTLPDYLSLPPFFCGFHVVQLQFFRLLFVFWTFNCLFLRIITSSYYSGILKILQQNCYYLQIMHTKLLPEKFPKKSVRHRFDLIVGCLTSRSIFHVYSGEQSS